MHDDSGQGGKRGKNQVFLVPEYVTEIEIKLWVSEQFEEKLRTHL